MVERVFRTPPMIQSNGFARMNQTFDSLARENGLTNMSNASGQQRRADWQTHKRLSQATDLIIGKSRSGNEGRNAGEYFKPLSEVNLASTGGGSIQKQNGQMVVTNGERSVSLNSPKPALAAKAHDGSGAGLPAGDA
jgi:hypothetical protein